MHYILHPPFSKFRFVQTDTSFFKYTLDKEYTFLFIRDLLLIENEYFAGSISTVSSIDFLQGC